MAGLFERLRDWLQMHVNGRVLAILMVGLAALAFYVGCSYDDWGADKGALTPVKATAEVTDPEATEADAASTTDAATPAEAAEVVVHVAGAVAKPGVYTLPGSARVDDAVRAAEATAEADLSLINLAEKLTDGQKIVVPKAGEAAATTDAPTAGTATATASGKTADDLININTATAEELEELPGIGEVRAEAIISHRETNGPFKAIENLQDVSGIGEKTYEKIASSVTV
ncbi:MAG: helix-hairpin-helix domain-containing protein [Peptococcaceae bacterium]|nr:helix-hairpin-helix domain-containing protein [Peptococcaceae bacterium]